MCVAASPASHLPAQGVLWPDPDSVSISSTSLYVSDKALGLLTFNTRFKMFFKPFCAVSFALSTETLSLPFCILIPCCPLGACAWLIHGDVQ